MGDAGDIGSKMWACRDAEYVGEMGGAPPLASSSSLKSGVRERPSESEKLFSRGIVDSLENVVDSELDGDDDDDNRDGESFKRKEKLAP